MASHAGHMFIEISVMITVHLSCQPAAAPGTLRYDKPSRCRRCVPNIPYIVCTLTCDIYYIITC